MPGMVVYACDLCYLGGRARRNMVCGQLRQKHKTLSKKEAKCKSDRGIDQMLEHLLSKYKVPQYYKKVASSPSIIPGVIDIIQGK
jgi:hypothetical protein